MAARLDQLRVAVAAMPDYGMVAAGVSTPDDLLAVLTAITAEVDVLTPRLEALWAVRSKLMLAGVDDHGLTHKRIAEAIGSSSPTVSQKVTAMRKKALTGKN